MAATTDARRINVSVSNFGPIAEGHVELRPFTVFVGPSNTGKSYLATQLYALHRIFSDYSRMVSPWALPMRRFLTFLPSILETEDVALSDKDIATILDWANECLVGPESPSAYGSVENRQTTTFIDLPEPVAAPIRSAINNISDLRVSLNDEVARCFGVDSAENLVRHLCGDAAKVSFTSHTEDGTGNHIAFNYEVEASSLPGKIRFQIPDDTPLRIQADNVSRWFWRQVLEEDKAHHAKFLFEVIAGAIVHDIAGPLSHSANYLPADRAGVMHAHQVAVRGLIASASRAALRPEAPMPVLSGVLGDFLEQLVGLTSEPTRHYPEPGEHHHLASSLENDLMQGAVHVDESPIGYPSFTYQPSGWERSMPLMNVSSMVSDLAPVVLYLRHVVQPGDTLIIEEPESHLHPELQVEFTRLLAGAVKAGIRIIITTHSEWILEELANLVLMSELPVERRQGLAGAEFALRSDEVGAWRFDHDPGAGGTVVTEMPLDKEMGTFPSGFGLITTDLYNRYANISNRIEELTEE